MTRADGITCPYDPSVKWLVIGGGAVAVLAVGIGLLARSCVEDKAAAERTVNQLYEALGRDDYEVALTFYHPDSWGSLSREQMLAELARLDRSNGARLDGHLAGWMVQKGSGAGVDLTYENEYENVFTLEEFHLVKLDGEFRILVHNYQFQGR
jgi:hypothetical protein